MSAEHGAAAAGDKQPEAPMPIGQFGQFLKDHGIETTREPDSVGVETLKIKSADLTGAMRLLKSSSEVSLDLLLTVSGVDSDKTFDSVYHLWSYDNLNELVLKVRVPKADLATAQLPTVPSVTPFWPAANWHERETYDLVGIRYSGHPYLRRILNPWDWEGYPLRRDYRQLIDALNNKNPHSFR
jgi:NADH-quinone oxidoreductase subunit C